MMSGYLRELQARRAHLVALAAQQRVDIARAFEEWEGPVALIDRGIAIWDFLKSRPVLLTAAMALAVMLRRRRAMSWMSTAVAVWRLYRTVRLRLAER